MDWVAARERLGAELIGGREAISHRFRELLLARGETSRSLGVLAAELVLQAGAALADGAPPETPWIRCGGVLRIDSRGGGQALASELSALWQAICEQLARIAFNDEEEHTAAQLLGFQLDAALRGAAAEVRLSLLDEAIDDPALRFGGIKLVSFPARSAAAAGTRAA
jgi:hypothetical protein